MALLSVIARSLGLLPIVSHCLPFLSPKQILAPVLNADYFNFGPLSHVKLRGSHSEASVPRRCSSDDMKGVQGFLFDCDGVIYSWDGLKPGVDKLFKFLHTTEMPYALVSNTLKLNEGVAAKFQRPKFKLDDTIDASRVYTVGTAMGQYMKDNVPENAKILAFGTERQYDDGTVETIKHVLEGLVPSDLFASWTVETEVDMPTTMAWAEKARAGEYVAVVVAFGDAYPTYSNYVYLSKLSILLRNGAYLIVAGPDVVDSHPIDPNFPTVDTTWPSLGGYEQFLLSSAEMFPGTKKEQTRHVNVGKGGREGARYMMEPALKILENQARKQTASVIEELLSTGVLSTEKEREAKVFLHGRIIDPHNVVVVGDNLGTDILAASKSGMRSILVLSGAHQLKDVANWSVTPTCYLDSAAEIPYLIKSL